MINRHEMSPSTRSNNFTNINFCHRESLTRNDLPDTEVLLCFSFMASGTDNEQMHLYQQEFQQRQAYKMLSLKETTMDMDMVQLKVKVQT